jgi:hypothetical protein
MPRDINLLYVVAYLGHSDGEELFKPDILTVIYYRRKTETLTRSLTLRSRMISHMRDPNFHKPVTDSRSV